MRINESRSQTATLQSYLERALAKTEQSKRQNQHSDEELPNVVLENMGIIVSKRISLN